MVATGSTVLWLAAGTAPTTRDQVGGGVPGGGRSWSETPTTPAVAEAVRSTTSAVVREAGRGPEESGGRTVRPRCRPKTSSDHDQPRFGIQALQVVGVAGHDGLVVAPCADHNLRVDDVAGPAGTGMTPTCVASCSSWTVIVTWVVAMPNAIQSGSPRVNAPARFPLATAPCVSNNLPHVASVRRTRSGA